MMQQMQPWMGMMGPMGMMGMPPPNNGHLPPNRQRQPGPPPPMAMPGFNPMASMMMPPFMGMNPMMPGMRAPPNNPHLNHQPGAPPEIATDRTPAVLPPQKQLTGKKSKKKDKDKPKRPLSAYNLFFRDERKRILSELPRKDEQEDNKDEEETSKNIKEDLKDPEVKTEDESKESQVKTKDESKDPQVKTDDESKDPQVKTEDGSKDPQTKTDEDSDTNAPNEDNSNIKVKRTPHGKIGFESLAKLIGKRWQELPPDEVDKYKKLADADAKRYRAEMEVFLTKGADGGVAKKAKLDFGA